jgi:homoserine/homoserine lactone efflux protein
VELSTWTLYALAAVGLSLTPGPNGLLALTHGALYGSRRTLATIFGGLTGFALVIAASLFGIGAILAANAELLTWLKWIGGAYLVFLGIQIWRSEPIGNAPAKPSSGSARSLYSQGLLSAVSNPKGILFFVAFLPQFVDPNRSLWVQFLIMAGTFLFVEFFYEVAVAAFANKVQPLLKRAGKNFNRFFGGVFGVLGVLLPLR